LLLLALLASCSRAADSSERASDRSGPAPGAVVGRVGQVELREADVQRAMTRDPGATPERFQSPQARRELLEGLIRFELLAQAAERAGLTRDPDAIHALQQIAVTKLVNQSLGAVAAPETITQSDLEREYAARQASEFTLPAAARVRHILVSDQKLAERLAAQARALAPDDDEGFAALASQHSQDGPTQAAGGDLGFVEPSSRLPRALLDAALGSKTPGEVKGPLATDAGYEIVRLVSLRARAVSPFSSVQEQLRQRLYRERRAQALDDLVARLRAETEVVVVEREPVTSSR
jgi:peptidyl-prolyl cis-trans isomerase C